ncbi:MAG: histone H1 [Leadbetterella sp.]
MNKYQELYNLVTSLKDDFEKFYDKENSAAGTRVRKGMQDLATWAKTVRAEVQGMKNAKKG